MGKISLWFAVSGIVLPVLIAFLVGAFVKTYLYLQYCLVLSVGLEVIGLITGIIGRPSVYGKAGLSISVVWLILTALTIPCLFCIQC